MAERKPKGVDAQGRMTPVFNDFDKEMEEAGKKAGSVTVFGVIKDKKPSNR